MTESLQITRSVSVPISELQFKAARSGGPGGQHVNTTNSKVSLSFDLANSPSIPEALKARAIDRLANKLVDGVLTVTESNRRSQHQNREEAERRMVRELSDALAPPPKARRPTKPTLGSKNRRLQAKGERGLTKSLRRRPGSDD